MPSNDQIQAAVDRYLAAVANGTAGDIAACYAEDASLEDPAGTEPRRGSLPAGSSSDASSA